MPGADLSGTHNIDSVASLDHAAYIMWMTILDSVDEVQAQTGRAHHCEIDQACES